MKFNSQLFHRQYKPKMFAIYIQKTPNLQYDLRIKMTITTTKNQQKIKTENSQKWRQ